ncbi:MAG TPA: FAD-binding protein [Candidatus Thioglobus sp.]|nr:FAD-binding protein [Candidatus Thioglobus sp.]
MKKSAELIQNFGRNLNFKPKYFYSPNNEFELLDILQRHKDGKIRVVGSLHSWSNLVKTDEVLIDMCHFNHVEVFKRNGETRVKVGAGCQIKHLLKALNKQGLTIPSLGLITEQTIAGATATGTHGSGKHSLSHYIESLRVACFKGDENVAQVADVNDGVELQAARCSLGCLGVIAEITLPCIPQYFVQEKATFCQTIEEVLVLEKQAPLQQFFLMPHSWLFLAQERVVSNECRRHGLAGVYRVYWFLVIDLGMHLTLKLFASILKSKKLIHFFFRRVAPSLISPRWVVIDRSDHALVMEHELFRHLEIELFVTRPKVSEAASFVADILKFADNANHKLSISTHEKLQKTELLDSLESIRGKFTHHYPVCFRRILPDDTLISMASGGSEDWYAISFITYVEPRDDFYALATFLANSMFELFGARIHWGKWFPQTGEQVNQLYPEISEFRNVCHQFDPKDVFRNAFIREKLGLE